MTFHDITQVHTSLKKVCRANCSAQGAERHIPNDHILVLDHGTFYAFDHTYEIDESFRDRIFFYCYLSFNSNLRESKDIGYITFGFCSAEKNESSRSIITQENIFILLGSKFNKGFSRSVTIIDGKVDFGKNTILKKEELISEIKEYESSLPFKIHFDEETLELKIEF
jgi:hypothetical protein